MLTKDYQFTVVDRFSRYVQIDTQSDPESSTNPSSENQKDLSRLLVEELKSFGVEDAEMDEYGYVYATIPANTDKAGVPVLCFCSHVDTAPDCSGKDVKPIIHKAWSGTDIILPDDNTVVIKADEHPKLKARIGDDIITASGLTLLGADDKAGVAEIMDAAHYMMTNPSFIHGKVRILFTPDEEVGRGTEKVDVKKLGADFGYTMDGDSRGVIEDETFCADAVKITIKGVPAHPGYAKGKMENAIKIAGDIIASLPKDRVSPETTDGKQGFFHPTKVESVLEKATLQFILRDFTEEGLQTNTTELENIVKEVMKSYPGSTYDFVVHKQYRNMKYIIDKTPQVIEYAKEAVTRAGMEPLLHSIRGGTDGANLSFMGLPCPNIFTGEHAIHSRMEWVSVQDMQLAVETILQICSVWEEKS